MRLSILLSYIFLFTWVANSQDIPPITNYTPEQYKGGSQNWMISQGQDEKIYCANNDGLLVYSGAEWQLYPSPNETIVRSVKAIGNRIYIGCYMEFGYYTEDGTGILKYTSLSKNFKDLIIDDEQFWNIIKFDSWVLFQSLNQIFIYNTSDNNITSISSDKTISKIFKVNNTVLYLVPELGLFEIENGKSVPLITNELISGMYIIDIYSDENGYLLLTQNKGFYKYTDGKLSKWNIEADRVLNTKTIYSSSRLKSGDYALGTISNGLVVLNSEGMVKYNISQVEGLSNNTILSLFEDNESNIWLGLDNGVSCLNFISPLKTYTDYKGTLGTVYASYLFNNYLYLGTNQGLFYKNIEKSDKFNLIEGTNGQVWSLFEYDNTLFCGHNVGTFVVEKSKATKISSLLGTWNFRSLSKYPDLLIQGNYNGLAVLKLMNGKWKFSHKIEGFDYSSKHFEILEDENLKIYVSHEYRGIFELQIDSTLTAFKKVNYINDPDKSRYSSLVKFDDQILYAFKGGIYTLNNNNNSFVKDTTLSSLFVNNEYRTGKMIVDKSKKLWVLTNNNIYYITKQKFDNDYKIENIPIEYDLVKSMRGFDNISYLGEESFLMGSTDGYLTIDLNKLTQKKYNISIDKVTVNSKGKKDSVVTFKSDGFFKNATNNIEFSYHIPEYDKFLIAKYQYLLEGFHNEWSEWSTASSTSFENLPFGEYTFKVKGKVGDKATESIETYSFKIDRPWYYSNLAIVFYCLTFVLIGLLINTLYRRYYHRQRENIIKKNKKELEYQKIESEKEIIRLKNEQLTQDVESKNRELAFSTMSLIKKNEFLIEIRDQLKKGNNSQLNSIIRTINNDINEEDTWNFFKEAFNNADKNFLKKVKNAHPLLTPNDLKLCAYLRLNLSSKEIAPLLNISVRSVEIKRYRLRKKMELKHEKSLVEYILSL